MHLTFLEVNEETVPFATAGIADATLIKQGYMVCENILRDMAM